MKSYEIHHEIHLKPLQLQLKRHPAACNDPPGRRRRLHAGRCGHGSRAAGGAASQPGGEDVKAGLKGVRKLVTNATTLWL